MNHVSYKVPPSGLIFVTNTDNHRMRNFTTRMRHINDIDEERKVSSKLYRETMSTTDMVLSLRSRGFCVTTEMRTNRIMLAKAMSSMTDPEQMRRNNEHEEVRFLWMNQEMLQDSSFDYKLSSGWYPYPAFIEMYGNDLGNKVWLSK